jgi:predicted amidophosphoribosyltransferase
VVDVKHAAWEAMAEELGAVLARQLMTCGVVQPRQRGVVLVPVPSPWLRTRARGIDHARALADGAARVLRVPVRRVLRQRLAGTQVDADGRADRALRADRLRAHRSCAARVAGAHVILVDDVRTTGATLEAASGVLRSHGASRITAAVVTVKE